MQVFYLHMLRSCYSAASARNSRDFCRSPHVLYSHEHTHKYTNMQRPVTSLCSHARLNSVVMVTWSHALSNCTAVADCQCAENAQSGHRFGAHIRAEMFAECLQYMWCEAAVTVKTVRCRISAEGWWGGVLMYLFVIF